MLLTACSLRSTRNHFDGLLYILPCSQVPRRTVLKSGVAAVTLSLGGNSAFADEVALDPTGRRVPMPKTGGYVVFTGEETMSQKEHGTSRSPVQTNLRWNVDRKNADRICSFNRHFAEYAAFLARVPSALAAAPPRPRSSLFPSAFTHFFVNGSLRYAGYWKQETSFLKEVSRDKPTIYYDSVTGKPLFVAPIGRSMDEFLAESNVHGWPSFRDQEVVWENMRVLKSSGEAVSADGTHLGHNLPDRNGNRYCINVSAQRPRLPTIALSKPVLLTSRCLVARAPCLCLCTQLVSIAGRPVETKDEV